MNEKRKRRSRSMKRLYPCSGCEWATDPLKIPRIFAMRMRRVDVSLYRAVSLISLSLFASSSLNPSSQPPLPSFLHGRIHSLSVSLPFVPLFYLFPPLTPVCKICSYLFFNFRLILAAFPLLQIVHSSLRMLKFDIHLFQVNVQRVDSILLARWSIILIICFKEIHFQSHFRKVNKSANFSIISFPSMFD